MSRILSISILGAHCLAPRKMKCQDKRAERSITAKLGVDDDHDCSGHTFFDISTISVHNPRESHMKGENNNQLEEAF